MSDTIVLLAMSQLVCLAGMAYLFLQVQQLSRRPVRHRQPSSRVHPMHDARVHTPDAPPAVAPRRAAVNAYASAPRPALDPATVGARMQELGVDVPALARRMRKSEEEVRLLLRRQGVSVR